MVDEIIVFILMIILVDSEFIALFFPYLNLDCLSKTNSTPSLAILLGSRMVIRDGRRNGEPRR